MDSEFILLRFSSLNRIPFGSLVINPSYQKGTYLSILSPIKLGVSTRVGKTAMAPVPASALSPLSPPMSVDPALHPPPTFDLALQTQQIFKHLVIDGLFRSKVPLFSLEELEAVNVGHHNSENHEIPTIYITEEI